jgi:hypothetical protein
MKTLSERQHHLKWCFCTKLPRAVSTCADFLQQGYLWVYNICMKLGHNAIQFLTWNVIMEWSSQGRVSVRCDLGTLWRHTTWCTRHKAMTQRYYAHISDTLGVAYATTSAGQVIRSICVCTPSATNNETATNITDIDIDEETLQKLQPFQVNDLNHWSFNGDDLITFHASMF